MFVSEKIASHIRYIDPELDPGGAGYITQVLLMTTSFRLDNVLQLSVFVLQV